MITEIPATKIPRLKLPEYIIDNKLGNITSPFPAYHSFVMFVGLCIVLQVWQKIAIHFWI